MRAAKIDHRLNRKEHARLQLWPCASAGSMDHFGRVMEQTAQAMPAKFAHHSIAELARMFLDRSANIAQPCARLRCLNPQHHAFMGDLDQALGLQRRLASKIHPAGVAMPTIEQRRHINIDNVALFQRLFTGDAVANDMVHRDTAAVRIAAIAQGCRHSACIKHHFAHMIVKRGGRHAGLNQRRQAVENVSRQPSCSAHPLIAIFAMQFDGAVAIDGVLALDHLIFGHATQYRAGR